MRGKLRSPGKARLAALIAPCALVGLGSAPLAGAAPSAVVTPIRIVQVAWGKIGYRSVGHGRPLVLVIGGSASIDVWAPGFIDALARHHRVLAFDNEGVGRTTLRAGTLTISRMADDTEAFIAELHLTRPDVLGWSMGGFVVQALAVRHPSSVRRIVLSATGPGDGSALPQTGLKSSPPFANFFPPDQNAARLAFIRDIHRYHGFYAAVPGVTALQQAASKRWGQGQEAAGHLVSRVKAPTLIADGNEDPYEPFANSQSLARQIPHAQLHIYSDAAHGFWFQDLTDWTQRISRFLQ